MQMEERDEVDARQTSNVSRVRATIGSLSPTASNYVKQTLGARNVDPNHLGQGQLASLSIRKGSP